MNYKNLFLQISTATSLLFLMLNVSNTNAQVKGGANKGEANKVGVNKVGVNKAETGKLGGGKEGSSTEVQLYRSKVWTADLGNGQYQNPILHADYSDPDAIRVGNNYYMISSSFNNVPGLPVLHSTDLVNWKIITHILPLQVPIEHFSKPQHGNGVWAPSIRFHKGRFYVYYPDPDFGIYLTTATDIMGPWTAPVLVEAGSGLIDPCPLWDEDGKVYLVYAFAGSRAGIKSIIAVKELSADGTKATSAGVLVYDGHDSDPTIEGPKFYKRNGYYYIFAPAGGVSTGWQLVLRSKYVYGPYERKVVMDQGASPINGPHQGAWVNTPNGEDWFLHFQDKEAYGRVVHLQPMKWINNWPVIGEDQDGDGKGTPVLTWKKPFSPEPIPAHRRYTPQESDEFNAHQLGLQWQWNANPKTGWIFPNPGAGQLRMFSVPYPPEGKRLWDIPNILTQKFPAETFEVTTCFRFASRWEGERFGLTVYGLDYAAIELVQKKEGIALQKMQCLKADKGGLEVVTDSLLLENEFFKGKPETRLYFRVKVEKGAVCRFFYSLNGKDFLQMGNAMVAKPGKWVGAQLGLYFMRAEKNNDGGYVDLDWFRIE